MKRRLEFIAQIRASLVKYGGNGRLMFRDLLKKRKASQLVDGEKWFVFERFFQRFVDNNTFIIGHHNKTSMSQTCKSAIFNPFRPGRGV